MRYLGSQFPAQLVVVAALSVVVLAALVATARRAPAARARAWSVALLGGAAGLVLAGTAMPTSWPLPPGEGDLVLQLGRGGLSRLPEAVQVPGSELVLLIGNLAVYAVLAAAAVSALVVRGTRAAQAVTAAAGGCVLLAVVVEAWQFAALGRVAATDDVVLNAVGGLLGAAGAAAVVRAVAARASVTAP